MTNLPERQNATLAPIGQAALFEDSEQLLALTDAQLRHLAVVVGEDAESGLAQMRRRFGLLAWAGWLRFEGKPYEEYVAALARYVGVNPRTVKSWRDSVVEKDSLAVPPVTYRRKLEAAEREENRRSSPVRAGKQHGIPAPIPAASTEASTKKSEGEGGGQVGETRPAPTPGTPSDPSPAGGNALGEVSAPPAAVPRPPTDRALTARVFAAMREVDPTDAGPVTTPEEATFLRQWAQRTLDAWKAKNVPVAAPRSAGRVIKPSERKAKAEALRIPTGARAEALAVPAGSRGPIPDPLYGPLPLGLRGKRHADDCSCLSCAPPKEAKG